MDIVVCNAAVLRVGEILEMSDNDFKVTMDINVLGYIYVSCDSKCLFTSTFFEELMWHLAINIFRNFQLSIHSIRIFSASHVIIIKALHVSL